jgi:hypothetical protein
MITDAKPASNYARLLAVLQANMAKAREPELIKRLRDAIHTIENSRGATTGRAKGADAGHGADHHQRS